MAKLQKRIAATLIKKKKKRGSVSRYNVKLLRYNVRLSHFNVKMITLKRDSFTLYRDTEPCFVFFRSVAAMHFHTKPTVCLP